MRHSILRVNGLTLALLAAALSAQDSTVGTAVRLTPRGNTGLPVNFPVTVQKTADKSSGSVASLAKAYASNTVKGNSLIVACGVGNGTAPTISDTQSNTWAQAVFQANSTTFGVGWFYAVNTAGGADTITCTNNGSTASMALAIYEVSGLIQVSPDVLSDSNSLTGTGTSLSTNTVVTIIPNQLVLSAFAIGTAAQTITFSGGFSNDSGQQDPSTPSGLFSFASGSKFLSYIQPVTGTATIGSSEPWSSVIAAFKPVMISVSGPVSGTFYDNFPSAFYGKAKLLTLPCKANTSAPSWSDGGIVPCSVLDTNGATRSDITSIAGAAPINGGVSGGLGVTGVRATGAADTPTSVYPVKVGGKFNTTPVTVSSGQIREAEYSSDGAAHIVIRDGALNNRAANVDTNNNLGVVLPAETTKVIGTARVLGNGGATLDSTVGAGTAPANQLVTGAIYNSTEISPSNGQAFAVQADSKGRIRHVLMDAAGNTRGANVDSNNNLGVVLPSETTKVVGTVRVQGNVGGAFDAATGAAPPANAVYMGGVTSGATSGLLSGITVCDSFANIQQTAGAQIITGVASRRIYICSLNLVTATAQNIAVVAGTGTVCATNTVAVPGTSGGTTAATGWNFAANGGIVLGAGLGAIAKTTVNADNLCILQSGSGQLSGGITYAIY